MDSFISVLVLGASRKQYRHGIFRAGCMRLSGNFCKRRACFQDTGAEFSDGTETDLGDCELVNETSWNVIISGNGLIAGKRL